MKPTTARHGGAKLRILETTENLFAESGTDTVSIRQITRAAGANVAAVNYHFGSRDGLVASVIDRYFAEVDRERRFRLERLAQQVSPDPVHSILKAYATPWLEEVFRTEQSRRLFCALAPRISEGFEANGGHQTYRPGEVPVLSVFIRTLLRHLPNTPHEAIEEALLTGSQDLFRLTFAEIEQSEKDGSAPRIDKISEAFAKKVGESFSADLIRLAEAG